MAQLFRPGATTVARLVLGLLVAIPVGAVALGTYVQRTPHVTRQDVVVDQPVPFPHEHHVAGLGIDCRYCHTAVEVSANAGLPPTETCMTCHSQVWTNAAMLDPVRASYANGEPIPWQRVHRLPDYVQFNHSIHVTRGVGCSTCHGAVETMPLMRQVSPLTMGWCLECHRDPAPNLRPVDQVFNQDWTPPPDQAERGRRLMEQHMIRTEALSDCSVCHR